MHSTDKIYGKVLRDLEAFTRLARLRKEGKGIADLRLQSAKGTGHAVIWDFGLRTVEKIQEAESRI